MSENNDPGYRALLERIEAEMDGHPPDAEHVMVTLDEFRQLHDAGALVIRQSNGDEVEPLGPLTMPIERIKVRDWRYFGARVEVSGG